MSEKKLIQLNTTTSITSNFVGDAANGLIGDSLLASKTVKDGLITFLPNIKYKRALPRISTNDIIQLDSPTFTPSATVTLDERSIDPIAMKVNVEIPTSDLEGHWMALQMKPGANNSNFPSDLGAYALQYLALNAGQSIEKMIWAGNKAGNTGTSLDNIDGIVTKALASGSNTVNVAPTSLSASNILAEITKVFNAIPATILDNPNLRIFVSTAAMRFYKLALAAGMGNGGNYYLGTTTPGTQDTYFLNVKVEAVPGMPTNNMLAAVTDNLYLGTDLVSDFSEINILDMKNVTGDYTLRYVSRFKLDVNYAWEKEIVCYGTQN